MSSISKILLVVEGRVEEQRFLGTLGKQSFGLLSLVDSDYAVVPFEGPIYELYEAYKNGEYDDLVAYLCYEKGLTLEEGETVKTAFAAVYLIFDFDPNYQKYSDATIRDMLEIFCDETELGKLYISYPMVEAMYHLKSLPDPTFMSLEIPVEECFSKPYKKMVYDMTCIKKNKLSSKELCYILMHNYNKIKYLTGNKEIDYRSLLEYEIGSKNTKGMISVVSTFPLMVMDYNEELALEKLQLKLKDDFLLLSAE